MEHFTRVMFTRIITGLARTLREEDFSVAEVAALYLLDERGGARVSALGEALALTPSLGSRLVDGLVRRGLVERAEDPEDRRAKVLSLTAAGRAFVVRTSQERVRAIMETAASLPAEAFKTILGAIEKLRRR